VALLLRLLVFPTVRADAPVDVDELSLAQVLAADLGQLAPGHDVVPFRALLLLAVAVGEALVGGDGELGDGLAAGARLALWILAASDVENYFVYAACHETLLIVVTRVVLLRTAGRRPARWVARGSV